MSSDVKHHHQKPTEKMLIIFQGHTSKRSPPTSATYKPFGTTGNRFPSASVRQNGREEGRGRAVKLNTSLSGLRDCDRNKSWFDSQQGQQIFPFSKRPCQLWGTETVRVLRVLSSVVERPGVKLTSLLDTDNYSR